VRPFPPNAFAIFERDLGTVIYADGAGLSQRWRTLHAIAAAEHLARGTIEYADLRFTDRVILKPVTPIATTGALIVPSRSAEITN
jgi:hypothetical protein